MFSVRVHGSVFGSSFEAPSSQFAEREQRTAKGTPNREHEARTEH
jgi:hypothetical protein